MPLVELEDDEVQDQKDFDEAIAKKRHKEISGLLKQILEKEPAKDDQLQKTIENHFKSISSLVEKLGTYKPENPTVTLETDNSDLVESFQNISGKLISEFNGLKECISQMNRPAKIIFTRDRNGFIQSPIEINYF